MGTRQYVGARYVPTFYDYNGSPEWRSGVAYEALTIVTRNGASYTSKIPVPSSVGEPENNTDYWVLTANYNAQIEVYRAETEEVKDAVDDITELLDGNIGTDNLADSSITQDKISDSLKLETIKDYITPEMFGAVMDGVTDDSEAFQRCVNYSSANRIPVLLAKDIYVNATINVQSYTRIFCFPNYEYFPYIILGNNVNVGLNCTGVNNNFENFGIKNLDGFRNNTAVILNGGVNYNVDTNLTNVIFFGFAKGVVVKGRNVDITKCAFSGCQVGVHYDLPSEGDQWRGLIIESCRFHMIGNIPSLQSLFYNSTGILIETNTRGNLTVRNCIADEGGTFIKGYFTNALIENNFVESFSGPIIDINGVGIPANYGTTLIEGNHFIGKTGSPQPGVQVDYPTHIIKVNNFGRIGILNNVIGSSQSELVTLDTVTWCDLSGNFGLNSGRGDVAHKAFCHVNACAVLNINDNMSSDNSAYLYTVGSTASRIMFRDNANYLIPQDTASSVEDQQSWVLIGTATCNALSTLDLPTKFIARLNDAETIFECTRYGDYYTTAIDAKAGTLGKVFKMLSLEKAEGGVIFVCREFDVNDISNPTAVGGTLYIYTLRN